MKKTILIIFALVVAVTLFPITTAFAYSVGDIHWDYDSVTYDMSTLPAAWQTQVLYAAGSWNGAGADFELISNSQSDNEVLQETMNDTWDVGQTGGMRITGTDHWYSAWTKFNTRYSFSTDGASGTYDIQSVAVHEFGHWLKLNDVWFWPWEGKVMYGAISTGTLRRTLHQDDIDGINAIY